MVVRECRGAPKLKPYSELAMMLFGGAPSFPRGSHATSSPSCWTCPRRRRGGASARNRRRTRRGSTKPKQPGVSTCASPASTQTARASTDDTTVSLCGFRVSHECSGLTIFFVPCLFSSVPICALREGTWAARHRRRRFIHGGSHPESDAQLRLVVIGRLRHEQGRS